VVPVAQNAKLYNGLPDATQALVRLGTARPVANCVWPIPTSLNVPGDPLQEVGHPWFPGGPSTCRLDGWRRGFNASAAILLRPCPRLRDQHAAILLRRHYLLSWANAASSRPGTNPATPVASSKLCAVCATNAILSL